MIFDLLHCCASSSVSSSTIMMKKMKHDNNEEDQNIIQEYALWITTWRTDYHLDSYFAVSTNSWLYWYRNCGGGKKATLFWCMTGITENSTAKWNSIPVKKAVFLKQIINVWTVNFWKRRFVQINLFLNCALNREQITANIFSPELLSFCVKCK